MSLPLCFIDQTKRKFWTFLFLFFYQWHWVTDFYEQIKSGHLYFVEIIEFFFLRKMSSKREKNVFIRLFKNDTVNSLARRLCDKKTRHDSLDLVLSSVYNHEKDLFVSKFNTLLQLENARYNPTKEKLYNEMVMAEKNNIHHPLVIGKHLVFIAKHVQLFGKWLKFNLLM